MIKITNTTYTDESFIPDYMKLDNHLASIKQWPPPPKRGKALLKAKKRGKTK